MEKVFYRVTQIENCRGCLAAARLILIGCLACSLLPARASPAAGENAAVQPALEVTLTTNLGSSAKFMEDEGVQFLLSLNRSAYVALFLEDAQSRLFRIFPLANLSTTGQYLASGTYIPLPNQHQHFPVQPPFGLETVWAVAATAPLPTFGGKLNAGFLEVEANLVQLFEALDAYRGHCACTVTWSRVSFTTAADDTGWLQ